MGDGRVRWVATGNEAVGFLAFGNLATGFFAFGNVARGVFAFGNLAVGVVAVGNVGFGLLFGGGATVSTGLLAYAGCVALPVVAGNSAVAGDLAAVGAVGVVPVLAWLAASFFFRGRREGAPTRPRFVAPGWILGERGRSGWVRAALEGVAEGRLLLRHRGRPVEVGADAGVLDRARGLGAGRRLWALLEAVDGPPTGGGYREAPARGLALRCAELRPPPAPGPPCATKGAVHLWLGRAYLLGAALGAAFLVGRLIGWLI